MIASNFTLGNTSRTKNLKRCGKSQKHISGAYSMAEIGEFFGDSQQSRSKV
jgi:hypothetical protein